GTARRIPWPGTGLGRCNELRIRARQTSGPARVLSSELSGTRPSTVNGTVPEPTTHPSRPNRFEPRDSTRWAAPASACRVLNTSEETCHVALKPTAKTSVKLLITYDNDPHATKIPSRFQTATLVREDK